MSEQALSLPPQALAQEALRLAGAGNLAAAEPLFARLVELMPREAKAWSGLGRCRLELGRPEAALAALRRAADLVPDDPAHAINLAGALVWVGRHADALLALDDVAARHPRHPVVALNRGRALQALGRDDEACAAYDAALETDPRMVPALAARAQILAGRGEATSAMMDLDQVLMQRPADLRARVRRAELALATGDWLGGLADYETRLDLPADPDAWRPAVALRRHEDVAGRDLLVFAEPRDEAAALAETLLLLRVVPLLATIAARVAIEVPEPALAWLATATALPDKIRLVGRGAPVDAELAVPFRSLIAICDVDPWRIPGPWPSAATARPAAGPILTVGLAPQAHGPASQRRLRDVPFEALAVLSDVANVRWVSLQSVSDAPSWLRPSGLSAAPDVARMAGVLDTLDMVVAADNWIAHLAGLRGVSTALLLDRAPDWCWLSDRTDTPWYPSMRLHRQLVRGDWQAPIAALRRTFSSQV